MKYEKPVIKRIVSFSLRRELLAGSVVDKAEVESVGQEVVEYDFSGDGFNHDWE